MTDIYQFAGLTYHQTEQTVVASGGVSRCFFHRDHHRNSLGYLAWFMVAKWGSQLSLMSLIAFGTGLAGGALVCSGNGWPMTVFRLEEGLDSQLARYLID